MAALSDRESRSESVSSCSSGSMTPPADVREPLTRRRSPLAAGEVPVGPAAGAPQMHAAQQSSKDRRASHAARMLGKYRLGRCLGSGAYATVVHAKHVDTGEEVAVKVLDKELLAEPGLHTQFRREVAVLAALQHRHCVGLKGVMASRTKYFLLLDYTDGCDLLAAISKAGHLPESKVRKYTRQLVRALAYCHAAGVCHRDIKPENVLVDAATGDVRLTDFGLATNPKAPATPGAAPAAGLIGTPEYTAPEVLCGSMGDCSTSLYAADVWSLGVTAYVMLCGFMPFQASSLRRLSIAMLSASRGGLNFPSWVSRDAQDFVLELLNAEPGDRPTMAALRRHPWLQPLRTRPKRAASSSWRSPAAASPHHARAESAPVNLAAIAAAAAAACGDAGAAAQAGQKQEETPVTAVHVAAAAAAAAPGPDAEEAAGSSVAGTAAASAHVATAGVACADGAGDGDDDDESEEDEDPTREAAPFLRVPHRPRPQLRVQVETASGAGSAGVESDACEADSGGQSPCVATVTPFCDTPVTTGTTPRDAWTSPPPPDAAQAFTTPRARNRTDSVSTDSSTSSAQVASPVWLATSSGQVAAGAGADVGWHPDA